MYRRYRLSSIFRHVMEDVDRGAWTYPVGSGLNPLSNPLSLLKRVSDAMAQCELAGGCTAQVKW